MRTEYKRDMNHNYLILTGDERIDTDSYQVRMIVANAVPDLLQCRIQGIDGKFMVYFPDILLRTVKYHSSLRIRAFHSCSRIGIDTVKRTICINIIKFSLWNGSIQCYR